MYFKFSRRIYGGKGQAGTEDGINQRLLDKTKRKRGLGTHFFFVLQIVFAAAEKTVQRVRSAGTGGNVKTRFLLSAPKERVLVLPKKRRLEAPP